MIDRSLAAEGEQLLVEVGCSRVVEREMVAERGGRLSTLRFSGPILRRSGLKLRFAVVLVLVLVEEQLVPTLCAVVSVLEGGLMEALPAAKGCSCFARRRGNFGMATV